MLLRSHVVLLWPCRDGSGWDGSRWCVVEYLSATNPKNEHECSFLGLRGWWQWWWQLENAWNPENEPLCSFSGFQTWWWQLNNGQNPENEHECSFSGRMDGGGQTMARTLKTSMNAHFRGREGGGGQKMVGGMVVAARRGFGHGGGG